MWLIAQVFIFSNDSISRLLILHFHPVLANYLHIKLVFIVLPGL